MASGFPDPSLAVFSDASSIGGSFERTLQPCGRFTRTIETNTRPIPVLTGHRSPKRG